MNLLLGYIGPETIMPVASALAALAGGLLFMGRGALELVARLLRIRPRQQTANDQDSGR